MAFSPARRTGSLALLAALAAYASILARGNGALNDPDPYWHIAVGRWILAHHAVPHHDIFSYSMPGAPWVPHEWLAELVIAGVYGLLGWAGLVVATALAMAAATWFLMRALLRDLDPPYALIGVASAWGLVLAHLYARPHAFTLPLLVVWVDVLLRARRDGRAPSPLWVLLMLVWANLHGGFIVGLALAGLLAGEALFEAPDRRAFGRAARGWGAFCGLSVLAAAATPNGVEGLLLPVRLLGMPFVMSTIGEWRSPDFQEPQPLEAWLLLLLLGVLYAGFRVRVTRIAILLCLIHAALSHQRNTEILGLVAPLLLAPDLGPQLPKFPGLARVAGFCARWRRAAMGVGGLAVVGLTEVATQTGFIDTPPSRFAPAAACAAALAHGVSGPVFNAYGFGGYLIFVGIAPFIDGRADMYGDDFVRRAKDIKELPGLLEHYRVAWTLLEPDDPRLALLDRLPGWQRLYSDDVAVVHIRDDASTP